MRSESFLLVNCWISSEPYITGWVNFTIHSNLGRVGPNQSILNCSSQSEAVFSFPRIALPLQYLLIFFSLLGFRFWPEKLCRLGTNLPTNCGIRSNWIAWTHPIQFMELYIDIYNLCVISVCSWSYLHLWMKSLMIMYRVNSSTIWIEISKLYWFVTDKARGSIPSLSFWNHVLPSILHQIMLVIPIAHDFNLLVISEVVYVWRAKLEHDIIFMKGV